MKDNVEVLNYIYKLSKMELLTLDEIKPNIKDKEILNIINKQSNSYFNICNKVTEQLLKERKTPTELSSISKVIKFIDSKIATMNDQSNSNIANTIIKSNTNTLLELDELITNYQGKNQKILRLIKDLKNTLTSSIDILKKYI